MHYLTKLCEKIVKARTLSQRYAVMVIFVLLLGALSTWSTIAMASDVGCFNRGWPYERSDLKPDDNIVRGELANQLRYVVRPNGEPEERVALYLYIQAGSLHESEEQRGVAHFLEHLMFNGSEHFPAGTLVEHLQEKGMDFGRDTNAFTSFDKTVYRLTLPSGEEDDLDTGMRVIADFARSALLMESEIDRERGVIFSEKKERDSAGYRTHVASTANAYRGTRYPERMVIGVEKTLQAADQPLLKSFYDDWYRPENMYLIAVGDLDVQRTVKKIEQYFSDLQAEGVRPICPEFGELEHSSVEAFYYREPELGYTKVALETYWNKDLENDSKGLQKKEVIQIIGDLIMGYRLQKLQEEKDMPFVSAFYDSGAVLDRIGYGSLVANTQESNWKETLLVIIDFFRQAESNGFTEQELDRAKKEIVSELERNVKTEKSLDSRRIARRIINHLGSNRVYMNASQELLLYKPMVSDISVADINKKFKNIWSHKSRLISVAGDINLGADAKERIQEVYKNGFAQELAAMGKEAAVEFPYIDINPVGEGEFHKKTISEIGVTRYELENGVIINQKKTDFEENVVRLAAVFGYGELEQDAQGEAFLVEDIVNYSGSNMLTPSAIDTIIAGNSVSLSFGIGTSAFTWTGSALTEDVDLLLQLLHTMLLDDGFRERAYKKVKRSTELMYERLHYEVSGAYLLKIQPFLAGNNIHFGLPPLENVKKLQYERLKKWAQDKIVISDLEISVVGNLPEDMFARLEKYFSGLELAKKERPETGEIDFPVGQQLNVQVASSIKKSLVTVAWPTDDFWDIGRTRRLNLLARVFEDRLRKNIRENLGVSYSPDVSNFASRVFRKYGYLIAQLTVQKGSEDLVLDEVIRISEDLYNNGVGQEELTRLQRPMVNSIKENIKTNRYWLYSVLLGSSRDPVQLEWPSTIVEDVDSITASQLSALAKEYLLNRKAAIARVISVPVGQESDEMVDVHSSELLK